MDWLKKNLSVALGIGLPVLFAVFFALASWLPGLFVTPPQYDVLFMTNYHDGNLSVRVENGHPRFYYSSYKGDWYRYNDAPKLYRFSPTKGSVSEISISTIESFMVHDKLPNQQPYINVPLAVPEADDLRVDVSSIAPDGYEFDGEYRNRHGGGLVGEVLFSSSEREYRPSLHKNGHTVIIPVSDDSYSYYNTRFIGWILP